MVIRAATFADGPRLGRIDRDGWSELTDPGPVWDQTRPFFGPPTGTRVEDVLVATDDEQPVGFVKLWPERSQYGDWYIGGLAVATSHRRRGVARTLIKAAVARAERMGGEAVWLKVLSTNGGALALYAAEGFTEADRFARPFPHRPGADDLRLTRALAGQDPS